MCLVGRYKPCSIKDFDPCEPTTQTAPQSVQRLCTDDCGVSLLFTMVCLFPLKIVPLPMLASGPHVIRGSMGPPESGTQMVT